MTLDLINIPSMRKKKFYSVWNNTHRYLGYLQQLAYIILPITIPTTHLSGYSSATVSNSIINIIGSSYRQTAGDSLRRYSVACFPLRERSGLKNIWYLRLAITHRNRTHMAAASRGHRRPCVLALIWCSRRTGGACIYIWIQVIEEKTRTKRL